MPNNEHQIREKWRKLSQSFLRVGRTEKELPPPISIHPILTLSLQEKVDLFRGLFKGREDVFARRWYSRITGKAGYQPVCSNEWNHQLCNKKKFKCAECPNRQFSPLTDGGFYKHLSGKDEEGRDVIGVYAIMDDNT